jgi:predicted transcriptional regulator
MKSVLISIQPKWCELIASGKKTAEVRKTKPKLETPFKVYIYCTANKQGTKDLLEIHGTDGKISKANGKVIGEFVCNCIGVITWCSNVTPSSLKEFYNEETCLTDKEVWEYTKGKSFYEWHISNLVIYDKPKELSEFVVEGDCLNGDCKKCKWFDSGNDYNVEADCLLPYDFHFKKAVKPLFRPPQSWCYVEEKE